MAEQQPRYEAPWPYGFPSSIDSAGTVAAPLLAGFSFTLVGLIVPKAEAVRWPGVALCLLIGAGIGFVGAVQCGFWARQWIVGPQQLGEWHPEYGPERHVAIQRLHLQGFSIWAARFSRVYRLSILLLLAGVAVLLVPSGVIGVSRWVAIAIAIAGCLAETLWLLAIWVLKGSPVSAYGQQPDEPEDGYRQWWRLAPPLRWIARKIVPIVRIQL
jgi:hypothetical protein